MFSRKDRLPQYKKSLFKAQKMHKALDVQQRAAQNSPLHRFTASPLHRFTAEGALCPNQQPRVAEDGGY